MVSEPRRLTTREIIGRKVVGSGDGPSGGAEFDAGAGTAAGPRSGPGASAKLTMLAVYDYPFARLAQRAGIDLLLVGDSLGMTVLGYDSPVPVTVDDVLYHTRAVRRGAPNVHVVADMPFGSYHVDDRQALRNAARLMQEGFADSVKLEGGHGEIVARIRALVSAGIPVMGHIGLTPQTGGTGGFGAQGTDLASARRILAEAREVAAAGAYAMVVEAVPNELASAITAAVSVPTIGIGAGPNCDGQTLVSTDMLGIESMLFLNFAKRYAEIGTLIETAFATYVAEVQSGAFPRSETTGSLSHDVAQRLGDD